MEDKLMKRCKELIERLGCSNVSEVVYEPYVSNGEYFI